MIILAIETSCDDTCVAILKVKSQKSKVKSFDILSNVVSSQVKLHKKYGGIFPTLAKREHQHNLVPVLRKALQEARLLNSKLQFKIQNLDKFLNKKIDLIGVTVGPGLEPCLWVGVNFAKKLAKDWNLPLIPINHIEAHIFANFIDSKLQFKSQKLFPAICLVVSGGHTQLILMKDFGKYKILGETRDDAAGECFDKTARIFGLEYPGGPAIAAEATKFQVSNFKFQVKLPRPMMYTKNYDFSFSGLKTAVLYNYQKQPAKIKKSKKYIQAMAFEIQQAIIDVLIHKTLKAAKDYKVKTIILGGGVTANEELRKQLFEKIKKEKLNFKLQVPSLKLCLDNAAMIGITAYFHWLKNRKTKKIIEADANLKI